MSHFPESNQASEARKWKKWLWEAGLDNEHETREFAGNEHSQQWPHTCHTTVTHVTPASCNKMPGNEDATYRREDLSWLTVWEGRMGEGSTAAGVCGAFYVAARVEGGYKLQGLPLAPYICQLGTTARRFQNFPIQCNQQETKCSKYEPVGGQFTLKPLSSNLGLRSI